MALLLVLWITALLAVLVVSFAGDARTELELARNQYESARARAIADAGASLAILGVLGGGDAASWRIDGEEHNLAYGGGSLRITVQDEAGKIDVNVAPPELLAGLLATQGIDDATAMQLVEAIAQWKLVSPAELNAEGEDTDDLPPRRRFLSLEELRLVPGMTRAIYERIAPFVTVFSRVSRIDPLSAPAQVLRSLPGITAEQAEAYLAARRELGSQSTGLPPLPGAARYIAHTMLRAVTVTAEGRTAGGTRFVRRAVVALTQSQAASFRFLAWQQAGR